MHSITTIFWDGDDAHNFSRLLEEAVNAMGQLASELNDPRDARPVARAYRRVLSGGFSYSDWRFVTHSTCEIIANARSRYSVDPMASAAWREAVISAAARLEQVVNFVNQAINTHIENRLVA